MTYGSPAHVFAAGESAEAWPGGTGPRLPRGLLAGGTARDRTWAARGPDPRSRDDECTGVGDRYWVTRRLCDGGLRGVDCFHLAARRARRAPQRDLLRGVRCVFFAARPIHRAAS